MNKTLIALAAAAMAVGFFMPARAQDDAAQRDPMESLVLCQAIVGEGDRLICYDAYAALVLKNQPPGAETPPAPPVPVAASTPAAAAVPGVAPAPAAAPAAATVAIAADEGPKPLTDDVAKENLRGETTSIDRPEYYSIVTRCEESSQSERLFFFMENGQVWKQSNSARVSFDVCQFEVTLKKDFFGYKMTIPSKGRTLRVSRVR